MDGKKVIAFVGMPGSGKGTCTTYLNEKYRFPVIHFGNMVYEEVQRRGLDNVKDENFVREDMRAMEGPAVLAKHVARRVHEYVRDGAKIVILDGLYSWTEYKYLHREFGDALIMIATTASKEVRHQRILNRNDGHRKYTSVQQIIDREIAEIENIEKGGPIAYADYTILNNSSREFLLQDLELLLRQIGVLTEDNPLHSAEQPRPESNQTK